MDSDAARFLGALVVIASALPWLTGMRGAPEYTVEVIQAAPCPFGKDPLTVGTGIAGGTVVGYYSVCFSANELAFIANADGSSATLPMVPGYLSMQAWDVNDKGHVVGFAETSTHDYVPFIYLDGTTTALPIPEGFAGSQARAVSSRGVVVGASFQPSAPEATAWIDRVPVQLDLPLGPSSDASDVNDQGQVVGWMGTITQAASAFVLDLASGRVTDLGHLPDGTGAASAINESGEIVGWGVMPDPGGTGTTTRAIRWSDGRMQIIDPLQGFKRSAATAINETGEVVGRCWNSPPFGNAETGFVWRNGVMSNLNELIPPDSGVCIKDANAIDDEGRITGRAWDDRNDTVAVRLTPIPCVAADLNRDRVVDGADLGILLGAWGLPGAPDLDGSGAVDGADLGILLGAWTG